MGCIALSCVGVGCVGVGLLGYRPPRAGLPLAARCAPLPPAGPAQFGAPPTALVTAAAVAATRFVMTRQIRHAALLARLLREPAVRVVALITIGGTSRATQACRAAVRLARLVVLVPLRRPLLGGLRLCRDARPRLVQKGTAVPGRAGAIDGAARRFLVERPDTLMVVEEGGEQLCLPGIDPEHHAGAPPRLLY